MICKNCGKEFSEESKICPECGTEYTEDETVQTQEGSEEITQAETKAPENETETAESVDEATAEKPRMSGRKKAVIGIAVAVALCAVLSVVIFAVAPAVKNAVIDNKPPKEYLEYIITEKNSASESVTGVVNTVKDLSGGIAGLKVTAEYNKHEAFDAFVDALGIDLPEGSEIGEGLDSLGITFNASEDDGLFALGAGASVNGADIVSANLAASTDGSAFYLSAPELTDSAAVFRPEASEASEINAAVLSFLCRLPSVLPEDDRTNELLDKYLGIAFDSLCDVEKIDSTVSVGNITQKCNLITVRLSYDDIFHITKNVLTEAAADAELKEALSPAIQLLSDCTQENLEKVGASELKKVAAREMLRPEMLDKYLGMLADNIDIAKLP